MIGVMAQWVEHALVLILVAGCAGAMARGMLRWAAGRQRGGCGGCAKCEPKPGGKAVPNATRKIVFLPVEHLGRKR